MSVSNTYLAKFSENSKIIVGSRIRQSRLAMPEKVTASGLAAKIKELNIENIAPSDRTITKYETGHAAVPLSLILALSKVFNCDPSWLAGLSEDLAPSPSLTKINYYQSETPSESLSVSHLSFKSSWLEARGVDSENLILVVSESHSKRETFLIDSKRKEITSDGYYALIVNGISWVRYIRIRMDGTVSIFEHLEDRVAIEDLSFEKFTAMKDTLTVLGRAFWVATDL